MQQTSTQLSKAFQAALKPTGSPAGREEARQALAKALGAIDAPEVREAAKEIFAYLQNRGNSKSVVTLSSPLTALNALVSHGFSPAVAVALGGVGEEIGALDIGEIGLITACEGTIDSWLKLKAGKDAKLLQTLTNHLVERAFSNPGEALNCGLATWLCKAIDLKRLIAAKPLLEAATGNHLPKHSELLGILTARDKTGDFVIPWLKSHKDHVKELVAAARSNSKLLEHLLKAAPAWLSHGQADDLPELYIELHANLPNTTDKQRAKASGELITLAGSLIPIADSCPAACDLLQRLQRLSLEVWKASEESDSRRHTWALIQAGNKELQGDTSLPLSTEAAGILGLALRKARKGRDAIVELESALFNIGVERIGEVSQTVEYDPIIHEDGEGGLIPGDMVEILGHGYCYASKVIVKSPVRKINSI